jgi:2-oxoglutarate ferredoxin oxidoreductase subunit alpha
VLVASDLSLGLWKRTVERSAIDYQRAPIDRGLIVSEEELRELGRDVFKRYQLTESGVSPRSVPGMPFGQFLATGNEHGENGKVTEDPGNRERMMHKRLHKLDHFERESVRSEGPADADIMLVAIGSTVGILREAKAALVAQGHRVGLTWLRYISPFPVEETRASLSQAQRVLVVEQNATGQLLSMMKVHGIGHEPRFSSFLKVNGVPFTPEEVVREVNGLLPVREVV